MYCGAGGAHLVGVALVAGDDAEGGVELVGELDRAGGDGQLQQLALAEVLAQLGEEGVVDGAGVVAHPALDEHHGEPHAGFEV